jgi:hypothetical protein
MNFPVVLHEQKSGGHFHKSALDLADFFRGLDGKSFIKLMLLAGIKTAQMSWAMIRLCGIVAHGACFCLHRN